MDYKEIKPVNPKGNQPWIIIGRTDAEAETPILWPSNGKSWLIRKCWERLKAGGEGDDRGQDGWMASSTEWIWVWVSSRRWCRTWKPGMLQSTVMKSQTQLSNWTTTWLNESMVILQEANDNHSQTPKCALSYRQSNSLLFVASAFSLFKSRSWCLGARISKHLWFGTAPLKSIFAQINS